MKKFTNTQYAKALFEATKDISPKLQAEVVHAFAERLKRDRRLADAAAIITAFLAYEKSQAGVTVVEVTSRSTITVKIKKRLAEIWGEQLEISQEIDTTLIGGARIRVGDTLYDATVDTQLKKLQQHLLRI